MNEIEKHIGDVRKGGYEMFRNVEQKYTLYPELIFMGTRENISLVSSIIKS